MTRSGADTKTVAVIGASRDRHKFSNKAVRAFRHCGYDVVPINFHHWEIEGLQAFRSVLDVPRAIALDTLYVRPEIGERIVEEVARKQISELWLNPGADGPGVIRRALELRLEPVMWCSLIAIGESPTDY